MASGKEDNHLKHTSQLSDLSSKISLTVKNALSSLKNELEDSPFDGLDINQVGRDVEQAVDEVARAKKLGIKEVDLTKQVAEKAMNAIINGFNTPVIANTGAQNTCTSLEQSSQLQLPQCMYTYATSQQATTSSESIAKSKTPFPLPTDLTSGSSLQIFCTHNTSANWSHPSGFPSTGPMHARCGGGGSLLAAGSCRF
eukprot:TRINITY_DN6346_c0_g2_i3.p1 TRINITY_DN6346_c0_g2~~TRINITY_DN6346_c0_g2_i3.p1  ORF type:complete len:205 (-),score=34.94 TRINITY_DN6346_c0_g2_i3:243-836(-)